MVKSYTRSTKYNVLLLQVAQSIRSFLHHICRQNVGGNLKGEMALFSFPLPSGGEVLRGAPLVYIPDLVEKVVDLLEENQGL